MPTPAELIAGYELSHQSPEVRFKKYTTPKYKALLSKYDRGNKIWLFSGLRPTDRQGSSHKNGYAVDLTSSDYPALYRMFKLINDNRKDHPEIGCILLSLHNHHIHIDFNPSRSKFYGYEDKTSDGSIESYDVFTSPLKTSKALKWYNMLDPVDVIGHELTNNPTGKGVQDVLTVASGTAQDLVEGDTSGRFGEFSKADAVRAGGFFFLLMAALFGLLIIFGGSR